MLQFNEATSSEKDELIEIIYEYRKKLYRVVENADFHTRLQSGKLEIIKLRFIYNLTILSNLSSYYTYIKYRNLQEKY